MDTTQAALHQLKDRFKGEIYTDKSTQLMYATDASAYRELPTAVTRPKDTEDLRLLIEFAQKHNVPIIPRTAGTSLAGQVVGNGIIADVSRYMTDIIELNEKEHWVRVQPGVVLDELNKFLAPKGLFFGPETSTSSRCMIAGMLGNNSCGAHSLIYGSTREHTLEVKALLSDGSEVIFGPMDKATFEQKCKGNTLENKLYQHINNLLSEKGMQDEIRMQYPDPDIERRNTGYAIDLLLESSVFSDTSEPFNFCKLLAGSEGTLAITTEIKLNLVPLPPKHKGLVCVHLEDVPKALEANIIALKHEPASIELMDKQIMDLTKKNIEQNKNRFFVHGDPGAILIVEFMADHEDELYAAAKRLEADMRQQGYGTHFPLVLGEDTKKVWALRKAGLGVLSNMPGDAKPVPVIEDTAVSPKKLPSYIKEFDEVLAKHKLSCVYYAHIATGELHLRPVLNLKNQKDVDLFYTIALENAKLVKKYGGSLSGEHGDGRLRGEFIPLMLGDKIYKSFEELKNVWDPKHVFNPGKIVDTPPMNSSLRFEAEKQEKDIKTYFDFSKDRGILRAAEKCNGSGDCRKTEIIGGTMCPSYMATRDESATTRARANILREFLTNSPKENPFDHKEIYDVLDLCLACKACKRECPSSVDMAKLKMEFLQHYYDAHSIPLRTRAIAYISSINAMGSIFPKFTNLIMDSDVLMRPVKGMLGFAKKRSLPLLSQQTLKKWEHKHSSSKEYPNGRVWMFNDEFTNYNDADIGIKAILLLRRLGYEVCIPKHTDSGRTFLSKGLIRKAKQFAIKNVRLLKDVVSEEMPLIGIEPSAILAFRDEYPELVEENLREASEKLAKNALLFEEFIAREIDAGRISREQFTKEKREIKLHGHCQQKAIASTLPTKKVLSFPENYSITEIPSGCCGMAGSFGYEKEHYDLSMKVGELVLFPSVRSTPMETLIAAPGTSCRHQIKDGTGRKALHPIEILYDAVLK